MFIATMLIIPGYKVHERIDKCPFFSIYAGVRSGDGSSVQLILYKADHLSGDGTAGLKKKLSRIRELPYDFWPKTLEIMELTEGLVHVLAPFGGVPLAEAVPDIKNNLPLFLEIARQLAEALGTLHQGGILHEGINSAAIWFDKEKARVILTGFGRELGTGLHDEPVHASFILSYLSPEGTGHTDLKPDERSDLYSLGVVLYEALAGELPFPSRDPLQLLHSHLAVTPPPPQSRNPKIPRILSDIIMKLLAKAPEERYQSAFGLGADLLSIADLGLGIADFKSEIRNQKSEIGVRIADLSFPLGEKDIPCRIRIRERVIGREEEKAALLKIFGRTAQGAVEAVMVSGRAGIGKTSLINEMKKSVSGKNGFFAYGKYNLFSEGMPYSGLIQALHGLMRQILMKDRKEIETWREKILAALGGNGQVLIHIIPDLERVIGPQPAAQALGPTETRNRFHYLFQEFLSLFASQAHPLVLFLDDLQWADPASLDLLKKVFSNRKVRHTLLIGAFRDSEVGPDHPLTAFLGDQSKSGLAVNRLDLPPLKEQHILEFLNSALGAQSEETRELAEVLWQKSLGNPFDAGALLLSLERRGFLNRSREGWNYDPGKIRGMEISENAAGVVMEKLSSLSREGLGLLKLASLAGHRCGMKALETAWGGPNFSLLVREILDEGLCVQAGEDLAFSHDRIREAALALIPEREAKEGRQRIGAALLKHTEGNGREEALFQILHHLNEAEALLTGPDQRRELAELNLAAAKKARLSLAFHSALDYSRQGLAFLPADAWQGMFGPALELHKECCDLEALAGDFEESERLFSLLLEKAEGIEERSDIYSRRISVLESISRFHEAKDLGLKALEEFGFYLSGRTGRFFMLLEYLKARYHLKRKKAEELFPVGKPMDAKEAALCKIYNSLSTVLFNTDPRLFAAASLRMVNLCAARKIFIQNILHFCAIFCAKQRDMERAGALIKHVLEAAEKTGDRFSHNRADFIRSAFVDPWRLPFRDTISSLRKVRVSLRQTGDLLWDAFALCHLMVHGFMQGETMEKIPEECGDALDSATRADFMVLYLFQRALAGLQGRTLNPLSLDDGDFREEALVRDLEKLNTPLFFSFYYILKAVILYIHGAFRESLEMGEKAEKYEEGLLGQVFETELPFYRTLGMAALFPAASYRAYA